MKWWVIILLVAVVLAGWAIYSTQRGSGAPQLPNADEIVPGVASVEYRDTEYGFSIQYPEIATTSPVNFEGYLPLTQTPLVSFVLPKSMYTGTNLVEAGVYIGATTSPGVLARCLVMASNLGENGVGSATINGAEFMVATSTDAGAGNFYEEKVYRRIQNGACLEIVELLHSGNIGNYTPGTVVEFEKAKFSGYLDATVHTYKHI